MGAGQRETRAGCVIKGAAPEAGLVVTAAAILLERAAMRILVARRATVELQGGLQRRPRVALRAGDLRVFAAQRKGGAPVIDKSQATILFTEEGRVAGNASCNRFIGGYQLTGEGLSFAQMGNTMMACEDDLSLQEARFLELLQAVSRFEIAPGGRLVLHAPDGRSITAGRF